MAKVLMVGCGDLGWEIAQMLVASGHELLGVRASNKPLPNKEVPCIQADVTRPLSLKPLETYRANIIIYCIAANAQSEESYRACYVNGLCNVLSTQESNDQLQHVFFVSSTRVYGQASNAMLNENNTPVPNDFGGKLLLEAESLLKKRSYGATSIRLAGIYGPGRLRMVEMAKHPSRWPQVNKWTNRIHRDDAARFIAFLCEEVIAGKTVYDCYIGTDDMPVQQVDVLSWLASKLGVERPLTSGALQMGGKRLSNQRMHDAGFQLTYANYQLGYSEIIKNV